MGGSIRGKMGRIEKGVRKLGDIGGVMRRIGREDGYVGENEYWGSVYYFFGFLCIVCVTRTVRRSSKGVSIQRRGYMA